MLQALQKHPEITNSLHQINQTIAQRLSHITTLKFENMEEKEQIWFLL